MELEELLGALPAEEEEEEDLREARAARAAWRDEEAAEGEGFPENGAAAALIPSAAAA